MKSLWNNKDAKKCGNNLLKRRVYTSRLLGQNPDLVLHGGGNTSVKATVKNFFGEKEEILYVKGSGWDLGTIESAGFAPVKMETLLKMADLPALTDSDMVRLQRAAMTDPYAPNPSVEAILHAIIPFRFVDHTHADAVVTATNTLEGRKYIEKIYGKRVIVVPYVMPGFILAKKIHEMTQGLDWSQYEGMILMNHGVFTFDDDPRKAYENMISLVSEAEAFLKKKKAVVKSGIKSGTINPLALAEIRKSVSDAWGRSILASVDSSPAANAFASHKNARAYSQRGPVTPDHIIRTKRIPLFIGKTPSKDTLQYAQKYRNYFDKHSDGSLTCLDPAPRWAVAPNTGIIAFGKTTKETGIIKDICRHTVKCISQAEKLGGWKALPVKDLFEMEYWELEQAKLSKAGAGPEMQGKVAIVTGAASGIGKACVEDLIARGAVVGALDINKNIKTLFPSNNVIGIRCDVGKPDNLYSSVETVVKHFGGVDMLVSNAGFFPSNTPIENTDAKLWARSLELNLTSHRNLIAECIPYLKLGFDPSIVIVGSKNVPAPGPGASAYSAAKAGLTQLARVAAFELGSHGIRINTIHPNAVYDTALWTESVLKQRAAHYGMTVEDYKANNVLKTEVTSADVASLILTMLGGAFAKTTGAQVPIDGGNDRVI